MPFTIPSNDVAGVPARQSVWYSTDIAILVAGTAGTGVLTGCAVTAQGTPDMTVAIAAGTVQPTATSAPVTVTAGNVNITAADSTDPRIDLVSASASGTKTVTDGTAAATPKPPALPSGHIALAMIDVPANDTTIGSGQITDKRAVVVAGGIPTGTSMPEGPSTNQLIFRTDLGLIFFWDGAQWLSLTLYRESFGVGGVLQGTTTSSVNLGRNSLWSTTFTMYLVDWYATTLVVTNNGSNYWTLTLRKCDNSTDPTIVSFNTSADTQNVYVHHKTSINATIAPASFGAYDVLATKTSGPGELYWGLGITYRLIGT